MSKILDLIFRNKFQNIIICLYKYIVYHFWSKDIFYIYKSLLQKTIPFLFINIVFSFEITSIFSDTNYSVEKYHDIFSSSIKYDEYLYKYKNTGEKQDFHKLTEKFFVNYNSNEWNYRLNYYKEKLLFYSNNLNDSIANNLSYKIDNNKFSFSLLNQSYSNKFGLTLSYNNQWLGGGLNHIFEHRYFSLETSIILNSNYEKINGFVENEHIIIPLYFYKLDNSITYKANKNVFTFSYSKSIPINTELNQFQSNINGNEYKIKYNYTLLKYLEALIYLQYNETSATLSYKNNIYGKLDDLEYYEYQFKFKYNIFENNFIKFGFSGFSSTIGSDSYFDIWAFTYLDIFLASRTRLKKFNTNFYMPNIGYNYIFKICESSNLDFNLDYYFLNYNDDIVYKERYFIFYPFIMGYHTYNYSLNSNIDGIGKFNIAYKFTYQNFIFDLKLNQLIPISFDNTTHSSQNSSNSNNILNNRGGSRIIFTSKYLF